MENRGTVRSVAKAMELLQLLSERGEPLSLTEIARLQELPKSTPMPAGEELSAE